MSPTYIPKDQRRRRALLHSPTLIGRDRELTLLREAMSHPPGLVLVEGEAGIGKSRLLREAAFHSAVEDRRVLLGHCHRLRDPFPLGPVVEALRGAGDQPPTLSMSPVVGALRPLLPELAGILPPEPAPVGEPRAERHRVFRALRELIGAFGPTVCVLEDLHWADEGTLELLAFLLSEPPSQLVLILTHRSEDLPASSPLRGLASRLSEATHRTTVELSPLSVEEVRRLMCAMLESQAVPEELASDLHERTAGIPFAVEEVVRLLHEQDQLRVGKRGPRQQTRQVGVPPAISQSIRERMGALDRDARLITQSAAVLAVWVDEDLLRRVAGLPPLRATRALTQSLSHGLLEEKRDGRYSFRHMLAAEAVYAEIPAPERRRLHLRAGRALETGSEPRPLAQLAHHFKEADRPLLWTGYAEAAAEAATSIGNDREAAMLLEEALRAPRLSRAARIRMAIKLGAAALYSVSPRSAIEVLQPISDQEPMPPGVRGELRFSLARLRSHAGDRRWREEMVEAVSELGRRPELAARAMLTLAWPSMGEGKLDDDLCWLDRAVEAAARTDDQMVRRVVSAQRAAILLSVGDPAGWRALRETPARAASIEEKVAQLRSCHNLSMVTLGLGHYRHAEHFLAQAARLDDELEHVSWGPWRQSARIALDWRVGRWEGLEQRAREVMESTLDRPALSLGNQLVLGSLLLVHGRVEEAERSFTAALELARPRRWMFTPVAASAWLARIRLDQGDAEAARQMTALGLDVVKRKGIWLWAKELAPVAVQALVASGLRDQARDLTQEFAAGLRGRDAPAARAASAFCQGVVANAAGDYEDGVRSLDTAERLWLELPCPYEAAHAREQRARCMVGQADTRGGDLLVSALRTFQGLGASWDVQRVRAALRAEGIAPQAPSQRERRAHGEELSPREAEIAELVGRGKKNREIAEALFLSPRTVEAHVAAALRKLGVESRHSLASVAAREAPGETT